MKKALIIFGTRPEAIKMAPVVKAFEDSALEPITCATGQHREMLDQVTQFFKIEPDYDLNLMQPGQDLYDVTAYCLSRMKTVLKRTQPDVVLVQGDTTTTFASALAAFYQRIPVAHIEAGLRTGDKYSPFPEEANRQMVGPLADYHFAPTAAAVNNLLRENIAAEKIFQTGNTAIDALLWGKNNLPRFPEMEKRLGDRPMVLMTAHRRENFGQPMENILGTVRDFFSKRPDWQLVYPVHPNPNVKNLAHETLGGLSNVTLLSPVEYPQLLALMDRCEYVLTDSGGLQEEAPTLGKPVLVLRDTTERPEAVEAGCAELVGSNPELITARMTELCMPDSPRYLRMSQAANPFGDGTAAKQIVEILEQSLLGDFAQIERTNSVPLPLVANHVH